MCLCLGCLFLYLTYSCYVLGKWRDITRVFGVDKIWEYPFPGALRGRAYTRQGAFKFGVTRLLARFFYCNRFFYYDV